MFKARYSWWLGMLLVAAGLQAAETQLGIQLGKHRVHPTRILARYAADQDSTTPQGIQLLSSVGLSVSQRFASIPGLVALDETGGGLSRQALATPDQRALALAERIMALRRSGQFEYVEPDYVQYALRQPNDEKFFDGTLWGLRNDGSDGGLAGADIGATEAWDYSTGSTNVIVAIIDTGIRYTHSELARQMWVNPKEIPNNGIDDDKNGVVDDVYGINALDPNNINGNPMDGDDHGTHVSGTIGARANDGNPHVGVAWDVRLMGCKFIGAQGGFTAGAIACVEYASTNGARILNNSWGGGAFSSALMDAIELARANGVLFVAAAGNFANDNDIQPFYPASYPHDNIIAVAALDRSDRLASFSHYGLNSVDLGAPGVEIFSSISISDYAYSVFDGTSMAAPHVSGVAALIRAKYPGISLYELRDRLLHTVVPIPALEGLTVTGGRVNAAKALSSEGDGLLELSVTPPNDAALFVGSTQSVFVVVTDMFGVTNATVTGTFLEGTTNSITFTNNGVAPDATLGDEIYSGRFIAPTNATNVVLELNATAPGKTPATLRVTWHIVDRPDNDAFAKAKKIPAPGGVVFANNKFATVEPPDEPYHAGVPTVAATLWWTWSPAYDNKALIDTAGTEFDNVVAVYTGSALGKLTEVVSADDANGREQPYVQFDAVAGTTYYIVVGGVNAGETGTIRLRVAPGGMPDILPPVVAFIAPTNGVTVSTNRITVKGTAADLNNGSGVAEVSVRLSTDPIGRAATGTTNWQAAFVLRPGENRILANAVDFVQNRSEELAIKVYYLAPTVDNDHFANAYVLNLLRGTQSVDTVRATREYLEPRHGGNQGGHSLWYRFTPPADGLLALSTTNQNFDTLLGVYTGSVVTNLTTVAGNDDAFEGSRYSQLSVGVKAGVVYSIAVDGYAAGFGTCKLIYDFTAAPLYRLNLATTSGGRVSPADGYYAAGSTVSVTAFADTGFAFVGWEGTTNSLLNPLTVRMDRDQSITAKFASAGYTEDFESGGFSTSTNLHYTFRPPGTAVGWSVQSQSVASGHYAAKSGKVTDLGQSGLGLTVTLDAGVISYAYRVSSEATWDKLQFLVDGVEKHLASGDTGWQTNQFVVQAGTHFLEWRYSKDGSVSEGDDAAYLDNIVLPLSASSGATGLRLQAATGAGGLLIRLQGVAGQDYIIQSSTDLITWIEEGQGKAFDGYIQITVPLREAGAGRFYRALQQ